MAECTEHLPLIPFDTELSLADLLAKLDQHRLLESLQVMLGDELAIVSLDKTLLLGNQTMLVYPGSPISLDLETIGHLHSKAQTKKCTAAASLVELMLRSAARYQMASSIHLETVQEDYRALQEKNDALSISEAKYRDLADNLEQRVLAQVKTIEDTQRNLYQSEKMASVGQLAAGVAHEINNPIGFINSNLHSSQSYVQDLCVFARLLAQADDIHAVKSHWASQDLDFVLEDFACLLQESIDGAARVARIVSDLKGFSNIDNSETDFIDINDCIRGVCNIASPQFGDTAKITLNLQSVPVLKCKPAHIAQMLINILLNAAHAVSGNQQVEISTMYCDHQLVIDVIDHGCGMNDEQLQRAFDPFFTTCEVGAGTGLGLTVARDIVLAHGGRINLASELDKGTHVNMVLPKNSAPV